MNDVTPIDGAASLRRKADALELVAEANSEAVAAGVKLRRSIVSALDAGAAAADVGRAAGLSRARIYQIKEEEDRS